MMLRTIREAAMRAQALPHAIPLDQVYLAHASGDATNAVLAAAGYNFRRLLAWLRFLLRRILIALGLTAKLIPA
jgi:hypothetical protein